MFEKIDYTLLKATATKKDIRKLCETVIKYNCASVCVAPSFVEYVRYYYPNLNICTVVGFPLGNVTTKTKIREINEAIMHGAHEIDAVVNLGDVKEHKWGVVFNELKQLRKAVGEKHILKIIIETCYLTEYEKKMLCAVVSHIHADYIKTSTGFGTGGATLEDIELMKECCSKDVKIKASGGIRTKEDIEKFINAGCDRIGTSHLPIEE